MVDTGRSFWRRAAAGIAFALIFASDFHGSRDYAAGIAATEQISTTNSKKKSNRHTRSKPKPPKPVPLDQLASVPIELGESDLNSLATFFQGLATLESPPPVGPEASPSTPPPREPPLADRVPRSEVLPGPAVRQRDQRGSRPFPAAR